MRKAILTMALPVAAAMAALAAGPAMAATPAVGSNGNYILSLSGTVKINRGSGGTAARTTETVQCDPNDYSYLYYQDGPTLQVTLTEVVNGVAQTYYATYRTASPSNQFQCTNSPITFNTAVLASQGQRAIRKGKGTLRVEMWGDDANDNWFDISTKKSVTIK